MTDLLSLAEEVSRPVPVPTIEERVAGLERGLATLRVAVLELRWGWRAVLIVNGGVAAMLAKLLLGGHP